MGRLFHKHRNDRLPQHTNDVEAPRSNGSKKDDDGEEEDDLGLVLFSEHEDQPYEKDEGETKPSAIVFACVMSHEVRVMTTKYSSHDYKASHVE